MNSARQLSRKPVGQMDSTVLDAESRSMVLCMGVATGAISAGAAVIRRLSLLEQSWKQPSNRLPSGSKSLLSGGGRQNRSHFTLTEAKAGSKLPYCIVAS